ncbi:hypothetical protein ACS2QU_10795 [Bacillus cereus group sp. Bce005]|uniref:hypothetical protein n=1 Tax=Bacillus cereus group TaxID=86661 RepID=UPI0010389E87|nr:MULTISPECIES: hypothetical protein [Bacillus cereus group]MBJ8063565.1 hypothetical protein [Bacillus cereus group sp. N15]TBX50033.1 hypothetical protein E0M44_06365 [Bacillus toyonensis]HDR7446058.1 hypothetical protein [Bacillus toyonensis]
MNRNFSLNFKSILYLTISIIIFIILTVVSIYAIVELAKLDKDWIDTSIGAIGNVIGGIIGGVVAYIVASFQVQKGKEQQYDIILTNTYSALRLLKEEIYYNQEVLNSLFPFTCNEDTLDILKNELQYSQWEKLSINLGHEISDLLFDNLCQFYRQINFLKNTSNIASLDESLVTSARSGTQAILTDLERNLVRISNHLQQMQ